ncbi:MAG: arsenite methyltransferase [Nitrospirota bacterium]
MESRTRIREAVRKRYAGIAAGKSKGCCGTVGLEKLGYGREEMEEMPSSAAMGLGCGSPVRFAGLKEGETVVDLGSGGGIDAFLAAREVGPAGRVIGVDMTPEMIARARNNAVRGNFTNVEFRHGIIENLPVDDSSADVVVSNCVINLVPDKHAVFREVFRVLKPGGRFIVSDMVSSFELPARVRRHPRLWSACLGGAVPEERYVEMVRTAGFDPVEIVTREGLRLGPVHSVTVKAVKPEGSGK